MCPLILPSQCGPVSLSSTPNATQAQHTASSQTHKPLSALIERASTRPSMLVEQKRTKGTEAHSAVSRFFLPPLPSQAVFHSLPLRAGMKLTPRSALRCRITSESPPRQPRYWIARGRLISQVTEVVVMETGS